MYFFLKYFLKCFFIIWLELSLFDCLTEDWRYVCLPKKIKSHKISRSFKRSYIDRNILYYNKNKIQIQMFVLFPNIFETKQYVTYLSNRLWCHRCITATLKQYEITGNNDQLVKCKSFNEISIIRWSVHVIIFYFYWHFVADNVLLWLFRSFYLRHSFVKNLVERDFLIRILFQVYFDFA
jgi:hypothetical protein